MQIYVINLDRSPERLEHVRSVFHNFGLEFTRVCAVDGQCLDAQEIARLTVKRNWPKILTPAEIGCLLSHRKCLQRIIEQGAPYAAIFEDDVLLAPQAPLLLKNADWIEAGIDIVKLDTAHTSCLLEPLRKTPIAPYSSGRLVSKHYCAGGYIISRQAAKKLFALTEQALAPIDEIYFNPDCGVLQTLNVQQLVPAPVIQAGLTSTIRTTTDHNKNNQDKKRKRPLLLRITKEWQRFCSRNWRPFWCKYLKNYYWGRIDFG